jgi:hypothetical protein
VVSSEGAGSRLNVKRTSPEGYIAPGLVRSVENRIPTSSSDVRRPVDRCASPSRAYTRIVMQLMPRNQPSAPLAYLPLNQLEPHTLLPEGTQR